MGPSFLVVAALVAGLAGPASGAAARSAPGGQYTDPDARRLHQAAMAAWKQRVLWRRDGATLVQVLAYREQTPLGVTEGATGQGVSERAFDPLNDRLLFGFAEPDAFRDIPDLKEEEDEDLKHVPGLLKPWTFELDRGFTRVRTPRGRRTVRHLVPTELFSQLADLPEPPQAATPATFRWGLQRPDLVRYNRVEGFSVGARGQLRPSTFMGPLSMTATVRLGSGDREPNARLDVTRETLRRRVTWSVFHELAAVDEDARNLGLGNSLTAALFGRDDGEYYRRSGTWLEWTPPAADRISFKVRAYAEYHESVAGHTDFNLWHVGSDNWTFRDNFTADPGWEMGGLVTVSPWWGTDPRAPQGGVELTVQGAGGDHEYARASLVGRTALPLPEDFRLALEVGGGTSWGSPPLQRLWLLGGAATLRGFMPSTAVGTSFGRARGELARRFSFGALSLFSDAAWAGDRADARFDDVLASVGLGLSLVDGLIRVDGAWGVRGGSDFRLEFYLDGIL